MLLTLCFILDTCHRLNPLKLRKLYRMKAGWMHDELLQFQRNDVWTLVPRLEGEQIIGTKWIFHNKTDEKGNVIRNKARLVA